MTFPSDRISEPCASLLVVFVHGLCFCVCELYCVYCEVLDPAFITPHAYRRDSRFTALSIGIL